MSGFVSRCCNALVREGDKNCTECGDLLVTQDEERAFANAENRLRIIKARAAVVEAAKRFVLHKQDDRLIEAIETLKRLEEAK